MGASKSYVEAMADALSELEKSCDTSDVANSESAIKQLVFCPETKNNTTSFYRDDEANRIDLSPIQSIFSAISLLEGEELIYLSEASAE
ncbi:hypothetical protein SS50377_26069 [Spironucleus salmonicida]|uniref:Uncharacterized protein n=1 Tax=Spironucleus salmonicida TaxID=348837 RepID=A0A9P8LP06_9EUKA|nr:hypothetical protein SS50377_26055 [Spironucleus salmonicida]KAH0571872.1 hypothetical protein SS50377_26069 [Spironucleus salmonicida]